MPWYAVRNRKRAGSVSDKVHVEPESDFHGSDDADEGE